MNKRLVLKNMRILTPLLFVSVNSCVVNNTMEMPMNRINSIQDIKKIFNLSVQEIPGQVDRVITELKNHVQKIISIPREERTFENTARALDYLTSLSDFAILGNVLQILELSSTDQAIREAAHKGFIDLQGVGIDYISNNKELYRAFKEYSEMSDEPLSDEQKYYVREVMDDFKRSGVDLPEDALNKVKELKKEIAQLSLAFDAAIAQDQSTIEVDREGLQGLEDDFINGLKKTDQGRYILGVDYPTYLKVMDNASSEDTRKRLYKAFQNRAYPKNEETLRKVAEKRDQLAKLLGFDSYAALDLDDQMVGSPKRARAFIDELLERAKKKELKEIEMLKNELPESVVLTPDGKLKPWDVAYLSNWYKKNHFQVDEDKVAEYFPMEKTIKGLLSIYQTFLPIEFEEVPVQGFWHEDVKLIEVYSKNKKELLGYLLLDLFPRPHKYSHAAHAGVIPSVILPDGTSTKRISVVWANFPKSTATKPSLLQRSDVKTFFHEFGHALHAVLGRTNLGSFAGTSVKRDFVELPSQMLEEWLDDKAILKKISSHYKTGEPLSDDMIDNILALKKLFSGSFVLRQVILSLFALDLFGSGEEKDPYALLEKLQKQYSSILFDTENHMYASFGHLTGYGAKYYGYLWSRVFAQDIFDQIKAHGLLNPEIGKKYAEMILSPGGSKHPDVLLQNFLGRAPNQKAFLQALGFEE